MTGRRNEGGRARDGREGRAREKSEDKGRRGEKEREGGNLTALISQPL